MTDNRGQLSRFVVWECFQRQTSLTGLLDTSGRGVYLTYLLSRMVLITVVPGFMTRIVVFFGPGTTRAPKPISIQMVPESLTRP